MNDEQQLDEPSRVDHHVAPGDESDASRSSPTRRDEPIGEEQARENRANDPPA
jgi:hypothetical protein